LCIACAFVLGTGGGNSGVQSGYAGYKLTTDHFRFFRARQVTRTWRVRTAVANAVRVSVQTDGTGGTTTYGAYHTGDDTWQTLSVTSPVVPTDATYVMFKVVGSASHTFYVGAHATVVGTIGVDPYVAALSPADDLARCLRYYEASPVANAAGDTFTGYAAAGGGQAYVWVRCKVQKAATPTLTKVGTWAVLSANQPTLSSPALDGFRVDFTSTAAGFFYVQVPNGGATAQWTVEANP
jgi:hypothetical protein